MRRFKVDMGGFLKFAPLEFREKIALEVAEAQPSRNPDFFLHMGTYQGRHRRLPEGFPIRQDLYAPDIAALDYLHKRFRSLGGSVVLDFACGIGTFLVHLGRIGFSEFYGYDDWSQIDRSTAVSFLSRHGLDDRLLDPEGLARLNFDILTMFGISWCSVEKDVASLLERDSLRLALLQPTSDLVEPENLEKIAVYEGLLNVYRKRKGGRGES